MNREVVEAAEDLGAEKALVPHAVEVLDDAVSSRLTQRDEAARDTKVQTRGHDRAEVLRGGLAPEVGVAVDWATAATPTLDLSPPRTEPATADGHDEVSVGRLLRPDVDQVRVVELDATDEVPMSDEVHLMSGAGPDTPRGRVRKGPWRRSGGSDDGAGRASTRSMADGGREGGPPRAGATPTGCDGSALAPAG